MAASPSQGNPTQVKPLHIGVRTAPVARSGAESARRVNGRPGTAATGPRWHSTSAAVNLAFYLAWFARYRMGLVLDLDPGNFVEHERYLPLQIGLSVVFAAILALRGLYRLPRAASALDDLSTIFAVAGVSLMILFAASTFVRYEAESRLTLIFAWGLMTLLVVLGRAAYLWGLGAAPSTRHRRRSDAGGRR